MPRLICRHLFPKSTARRQLAVDTSHPRQAALEFTDQSSPVIPPCPCPTPHTPHIITQCCGTRVYDRSFPLPCFRMKICADAEVFFILEQHWTEERAGIRQVNPRSLRKMDISGEIEGTNDEKGRCTQSLIITSIHEEYSDNPSYISSKLWKLTRNSKAGSV